MNTSVHFVRPSAILQDVIDFYYLFDINVPEISMASLNHYHIHMADGGVEMLFGLHNSSFQIQTKAMELLDHKSFLFGPKEVDNLIQSTGYTSTFKGLAIRFSFLGLFRVFNISLNEIKNGNYETDEVFGSKMILLKDKLEHSRNNDECIGYLNKFFTKQLEMNNTNSFKVERCKEAFRIINQFHGNVKLSALWTSLSVCERTMERDFRLVGGMGPKDFCKNARLNKVIISLYNDISVDWAQLVHDNCYYDQAHMIKEFKNAVHVTPEWFFLNRYKNVFKNSNQIIFPATSQLSKFQFENIMNATDEGFRTYIQSEVR